MNKRSKEILFEMGYARKALTIGFFAEKYDVSERTIRNDLNLINNFLKENDMASLYLKSNGVIECELDIKRAQDLLNENDFFDYKLSKKERQKLIAYLLVSSSEQITLQKIAESLFVSRSTIISDLEQVKKYLKQNYLEVVTYSNKGLRLEGMESDKRQFILLQIINKNSGFSLEQLDDLERKAFNLEVPQYTKERIMIQKIINEQENLFGNYFTDDAFDLLMHYLMLMIKRIQLGEFVEQQKTNTLSENNMAKDILKYITQYCHTMTTEDEMLFLGQMLNNMNYIKKHNRQGDIVKVQLFTRRFIEGISEELQINLNDDFDFYENLSNHLSSIVGKTLSSGEENPFVKDIVRKNPEVLKAVGDNIEVFESYCKKSLNEAERAYVVIHICAAIERKKNKEVSLHVALVCNGGVGTSQLLLEKLKKHFNFQIVDIYSAHSLTDDISADLIISTIPLDSTRFEFIQVSPYLNDEDYMRVGEKIDEIRSVKHLPVRKEYKELTSKGLMERIEPILCEVLDGDITPILNKISKATHDYFNQNHKTEDPYLHQLLWPQNIQVDVACTDWKDAIFKSAKNLLKQGYIEERYIKSMIDNVNENGPYIVISKGFALPHNNFEDGTYRLGMNLIRLKTPVIFDADENDPIEFVCCLSPVDHKSHLKAFFNLVNMLGNEGFKEELRKAQNSEKIYEIIKKYEYRIKE